MISNVYLHLLKKEQKRVLGSLKIISTLVRHWKAVQIIITNWWKFLIDDNYQVLEDIFNKNSDERLHVVISSKNCW